MRSSSSAFVVVALLAFGGLPAAAQEAGDTCTTGTAPVCSATTEAVLFCSDTGVYEAQVCNDFIPGATCGQAPCSGADCAQLGAGCVSERNDKCIGVSPIFNEDTADNGLLMYSPCETGSVCALTSNDESCVAPPAGVSAACTAATEPTRCVGDTFVMCIGYEDVDATIGTAATVDCAAFDLVCNAANGCVEPTADPRCANSDNDNGSCVNNVAHFCIDGVVTSSTDCSNTGRVCVIDNGGACVTADPECGPSGLGQCDGNVATVCAGGSFVNTVDCTGLGRRCGSIDANGQIGCAVGEGEGEGEGEEGEGEGEVEAPECSTDADCEADETCEDGECERERSRGRDDDDEEEAAGFLTCATSGASLPVGLAVLGLLLRRRRQR